jgi:hypothetical protein
MSTTGCAYWVYQDLRVNDRFNNAALSVDGVTDSKLRSASGPEFQSEIDGVIESATSQGHRSLEVFERVLATVADAVGADNDHRYAEITGVTLHDASDTTYHIVDLPHDDEDPWTYLGYYATDAS